VGWGDPARDRTDGIGVVRRWVAPPAGLDALRDHAVIDHDRAAVELVDTTDGDEPGAVTIKRFPNWGDAADLIAVLDTGAVVPEQTVPSPSSWRS
jgi:hypothetical protein